MTNAVASGFDAGVVTDGVGHASHMTAITPRGIVARTTRRRRIEACLPKPERGWVAARGMTEAWLTGGCPGRGGAIGASGAIVSTTGSR